MNKQAQRTILNLVINNPHITLLDLQKELGYATVSSVNYHVAFLLSDGHLQRPGKHKRSFVVTPSGYALVGKQLTTCKCCGAPMVVDVLSSSKSVDEN